MQELPTVQAPPRLPGASGLTPAEIAELSAEVKELAKQRDAVILAHNYELPELQDVADFVGDSLGLSRRRRHRRLGDRLLRRPLHGRDRLGALTREDRADPRPRRRLFAGRLDHRRAARRLEGGAPGGDGRDVRQHVGRGQG